MFEIVKQTRKHAWAFCPEHKDLRTPNLCISLEEDTYGLFYCFVCGYRGRLPAKQMALLNMRKQKRTKPISIDWKALTLDYYNKYRPAIEGKYLCEQFNVCGKSITDFRGGWDGEAFTFPMYNADCNVIGIQRRFKDGSKCCVEGSQLGLFIPFGYNLCDTPNLFICEGVSDACSVSDLGFSAIGRPNCNIGNDMIVKFLNNTHIKSVVLIPDNDKAGKDGANILWDNIFSKTEARLKWFEFDVRAKDIREYIKIVGKKRVQKELSEYVSIWR